MVETTKRILSGMRPTGDLHIGNYFGAIRQFVDLQQSSMNECFFFIADLHALTEVRGSTDIDRLSVEVAKNYIACGIDPLKSTLYRQSDVPEVSEIALLLMNVVSIGRLRLCTTFKDRLQNRGKEEGEVSFGLLGYPILMASDIFAVRGECVPVGQDQIQHVEMARDFARSFNNMFNTSVLVVPSLNEMRPIKVPGIDGKEKMGKSDGNTVALLESEKLIRKKIARIPTQTEMGSDIPLASSTQALYALTSLCCSSESYQDYCERYQRGDSQFFGEMKTCLADAIVALLSPIQERYRRLHDDDVRQILLNGAERARKIAQEVVQDMRRSMGISLKG